MQVKYEIFRYFSHACVLFDAFDITQRESEIPHSKLISSEAKNEWKNSSTQPSFLPFFRKEREFFIKNAFNVSSSNGRDLSYQQQLKNICREPNNEY
jgi:hypothetical protein